MPTAKKPAAGRMTPATLRFGSRPIAASTSSLSYFESSFAPFLICFPASMPYSETTSISSAKVISVVLLSRDELVFQGGNQPEACPHPHQPSGEGREESPSGEISDACGDQHRLHRL